MTAGGETLFGEWSDTSQGCAPWKQQVNSPINTHRQPVYKKKDRNWVSSIAWNVHYLPPAAQSLGERHVSNAWGLGWGKELTDISGYVM